MGYTDRDRPLAFTDAEMTGLIVDRHEIIEIGLVLVAPATLEVLCEFETKAKPLKLETADPRALEINGYNHEEWKDAPYLEYALANYLNRTAGATFVSDNIPVDLGFINAAIEQHRLWNRMHFRFLDLFSFANGYLHNSQVKNFEPSELAVRLGIPEEPKPHRALRGARRNFELYKKIVTGT